ncbi:MAG TPA: M20/M25/M40 family metallo-hydrolase [Kofleriaceae bacterium]
MLRIPCAALLLLVLSAPSAAAPSPPAAPSCIDGDPYAAAAIGAQIAALAAPALDGRAAGSPGDAAGRALIAARFACLGLTPAGDDGGFVQAFTADRHATANLVGYVPGDGPHASEIIVVGAHHDHLGGGKLGANDDASGIAALLAIAQAVRQHGSPARTIAFVAFGGEELGLLGSAHFAAHPPAALPLARVVYDVNLDMIGSYASAGAVYAMGTFPRLAGTKIMKALASERRTLHVGLGGRGVGSDHEAFCAAGIPYVFFWTPDHRCYHAACDTADKLDLRHAAQIAELAGTLVERLAASADLTTDRRCR